MPNPFDRFDMPADMKQKAINVFDPGAADSTNKPQNPFDQFDATADYSNGAELKQGKGGFNENPTANVTPENDYSHMPGIMTQMTGSLPTEPKDRAMYFAKKRFPNLPPEEAISRYGVQGGRIFYQDNDGKAYFEEPDANLSLSGTPRYIASGAGPALPAVGSAIGGATSFPVMWGIPGAAVGGAAGDQARQALAMALAGQKQYSPGQTVTEAGKGAFGQAVGSAAIGVANRKSARDVERYLTPEAKAAAAALREQAKKLGIDLTPAEITNLNSLKGQQNVLGDVPHSANIMQDFYAQRNTQQVPKAVDKMLNRISATESVEVGGKNLAQGAKGAVAAAKEERAAAASPLYQKAFASPAQVDTSGVLNLISSKMNTAKGSTKTALKKAEEYLMREVEEQAPDGSLSLKIEPDTRVEALHQAKLAMDDLIDGTAESGIGRSAKRELVQIQDELLKAIDSASPEYAAARAAHKANSPAVNALTDGEIGIAADANPLQYGKLPKTMFDSGPEAIKSNRYAYEKAGKLNEWNDGLRAYLQDNFTAASKEFKSGNTNPGASFRAKVFGTDKQKANLRSAMSPMQWNNFNTLMDVLEATGRVPQGGSRTAFASEAMNEMRRDAAPLGPKVSKVFTPQNWGRDIGNWYQELKFGQHAEDLAKIITSPDGMEKLAQLKKVPPNSEKARSIVAQLLTSVGTAAAKRPNEDVQPGGFSKPK